MRQRRFLSLWIGYGALALAASASTNPAAAAGSPRPGTLQPDLVIVDAQSIPANPNRLRVRVANQGLAPAVETRIQLLYRRGGTTTPMTAAVPFLQAGERQWLVFEVGARATDADALSLHIDEPPRVIESNEDNNGYRFK